MPDEFDRLGFYRRRFAHGLFIGPVLILAAIWTSRDLPGIGEALALIGAISASYIGGMILLYYRIRALERDSK